MKASLRRGLCAGEAGRGRKTQGEAGGFLSGGGREEEEEEEEERRGRGRAKRKGGEERKKGGFYLERSLATYVHPGRRPRAATASRSDRLRRGRIFICL